MGQYFTPVFLNTDDAIVAALNPGDYGSGDKLFGHTRADTRLIYAVQTVLALDGGLRLVWAGDYAPEEPGRSANLYFLTEDRHFLRFAGLVNDELTPNTALPNGKKPGTFGYLCNIDKHEYVENLTLPIDDTGWRRTPLPTLTAEGGQTRSPSHDLGSWRETGSSTPKATPAPAGPLDPSAPRRTTRPGQPPHHKRGWPGPFFLPAPAAARPARPPNRPPGGGLNP
jgi:hypothetical protein